MSAREQIQALQERMQQSIIGQANATAALELARAVLAVEEVPGAILFVLDDFDRADLPAFERHMTENGPRVVFLSIGGSEAELDDLSRISGAAVVRVTPDAADVAEARGRHTAPPIRLRWFNLREYRVETASVDGFEIVVRGPPPAPPSSFDWRAIVFWVALGTLFVALAIVAVMRPRPRISRWRQRQREAYLASEAFAFTKAMAALRAHDFRESLHSIELWLSRLPPGDGVEQDRLSDALVQIGAALYGLDQCTPVDRQWSEAIAALRATRRSRSAATATDRALPPLNPQLVP